MDNTSNFKIFINKRENIYLLLLSLVMILQSFTVQLSSCSVGLLFLFYICDKNMGTKLKKAFSYKTLYLFLGYLLVQVIGIIHTENLADVQLHRYALFILPIVLYSEPISRDNLIVLFRLFFYVMILLPVVVIFYEYIYEYNYLYEEYGLHPMHQSNNFYLGVILGLYLYDRKKIGLYGCIFGVLLYIIAILVASSRINFISLIIYLMGYFIVMYKFNKKALIFCFMVLLVGFFIISNTDSRLSYKMKKMLSQLQVPMSELVVNGKAVGDKLQDINLRKLKWYLTCEIISENFWFGVGLGDARDELLKKYRQYEFKQALSAKWSTHNQYLQEWLKHGVLGILSLLYIFGYIFVSAIKNRKWLVLAFISNIIIVAATDSIFEWHHRMLFFVFFLPLIFIFDEPKRKNI